MVVLALSLLSMIVGARWFMEFIVHVLADLTASLIKAICLVVLLGPFRLLRWLSRTLGY
jgi:hypothetical protein